MNEFWAAIIGAIIGGGLTYVASVQQIRLTKRIYTRGELSQLIQSVIAFASITALKSEHLEYKDLTALLNAIGPSKYLLERSDREFLENEFLPNVNRLLISIQTGSDQKYELWFWFACQIEGGEGNIKLERRFEKYLVL